jgi:hypothetical protein
MVELADIFTEYGPGYRQKYGEQMPASHLRAMWHIEHCRTETMGGEVYVCDKCQLYHYSYHSCGDRHCPKCQHQAGQEWLVRQLDFQLPVPYFMVTFTLPAGLRQVIRSNQKLGYDLLFRTSAAALQELAQDPRYVGGQIGLMGVLHTWGRDPYYYHPHVHYLVPGGGVSLTDEVWRESRKDFLVHIKPLSKLFRAKFRAELKKREDLFEQVPAKVWKQKWVVHIKAVGNGETALKYLTPYVFRVAISNKRIVKLEDGQVTYRYTASDSGQTKYVTVPAEKFIRGFLQHVLLKGLVKVRYYGLFSPSYRPLLHRVRLALADRLPPFPPQRDEPESKAQEIGPKAEPTSPEGTVPCPQCGRPMSLVETLKPKRGRPP